KITPFFLKKFKGILDLEKELKEQPFSRKLLNRAKKLGFSDIQIARAWESTENDVYELRMEENIVPIYKMVDTCAAQYDSKAPYFYSSYDDENESIVSDKEKVLVLGSGPIRIGQGIEFDYATVHSVLAIKE